MIQLTITLNDNKTISVTGPIDDKFICYALLESARDVIKDYKPSAIVAPDQNLTFRN